MDKSKCAVGQLVVNTMTFALPAGTPARTMGKVIECLPEEVWVQFPGNKRVRKQRNR
jgi:hypothetical protein